MTEQSSTPTTGQSKRRWLAFGFWFALLAANIVTSYAAASAVTAGGLLSIFFQAFNRVGSTGNPLTNSGGSSAQLIVTLLGVGLALVAIVLILNAWLKFAHLSQALVVSLAWLERDETDITVFFDWLIFSEKSAEVTTDQPVEAVDLDAADSSLIGQIVKNLGIAWAILLAVSPLTSLVGVFFM